jgi:hypothetical protein
MVLSALASVHPGIRVRALLLRLGSLGLPIQAKIVESLVKASYVLFT